MSILDISSIDIQMFVKLKIVLQTSDNISFQKGDGYIE